MKSDAHQPTVDSESRLTLYQMADAEIRNAKVLADQIRTRIAAALATRGS